MQTCLCIPGKAAGTHHGLSEPRETKATWNSTALSRRLCSLDAPLKDMWRAWGEILILPVTDPSSPGASWGVWLPSEVSRRHWPDGRTLGPRPGCVPDSGLSQGWCFPVVEPRCLCCGLRTITRFLGAGEDSVPQRTQQWTRRQMVARIVIIVDPWGYWASYLRTPPQLPRWLELVIN